MGDRRDRLEVAGPGEIVAVVGLKQTYTGNTLCATDQPIVAGRNPLPRAGDLAVDHPGQERRTRPSWPTPWARWCATTRRCKCRTDPETNQLIISGMGELHLEVSVHKLQRDHGVKVTVGKPQVAYRQTLAKAGRDRDALHQAVGRPRQVRRHLHEVRAADQGAGRGVDGLPGGAGREARPEQHLLHEQDLRRRGADGVHPVGGGRLPRRAASRGPSTASRAWTCKARC